MTAPWRRFFAREIDLTLYSLLIANLIVLLVEPLFLTFTGTTPGKFCFGLKVAALSGKSFPMPESQ